MESFVKTSFLKSALLLLMATSAQAAQVASFCTLSPEEGAIVQGTNVDERLPIASVSKVATTWFGIAEKGLRYRFRTLFHVTPVENGLYDVHIQGSRDPYFGRESLHFAISELNRVGITRVRRLSFDENFKFYKAVTSNSVAAAHYVNSSPSPASVMYQLETMNGLTSGWSATQAMANLRKLKLEKNPKFSVEKMVHIPAAKFTATPESKMYAMNSTTLQDLVKEMNRNSNNHAANQIFEHLGGVAVFQKTISEKLGLNEKDIRFVNGSGDRFDTEDNRALYNEASCSAMLKILKSLRESLKNSGKDLQNVMAVVGEDADSTVSARYTNDMTSKAVVAKTGTVNPAITLAGIVNSKKGEVFFMYNIATNREPGDQSEARAMIRTKLIDFIRTMDGPSAIDYHGSLQFLNFDRASWEKPFDPMQSLP